MKHNKKPNLAGIQEFGVAKEEQVPQNKMVENDQQKFQDPENDHPHGSEPSNSVPFPELPEAPEISEPIDEQYGRGQRSRKPMGAYRAINEGLIAAIAEYIEPYPDETTNSQSNDDGLFSELPPDFALIGSFGAEPSSIDDALHGPDAKKWQAALDYEINQLEKLGTWVIEELPNGQMAIPCREVLKIKRGPNGEIQSYRVRIVAGGHKQVEGLNYNETFSAAAKMPMVRVVLGNAAIQNWELEHVDVKSAYLNAPLKEVIYMNPPRGVLKPGQEGKYCRLLKGLYGLKQAGRGWYQEMSFK